LFIFYVCFCKIGADINETIDEPDIAKDEPNVCRDIVVASDIAQANVSVDTASYFFNAKKYKNRDELIDWCKNEAIKAGFTMVIEKSHMGKNNRKPFFVLGCERGGVYKEPKRKLKREDTKTRKCECPFRLRGYFVATQEWKLSVVSGEHNHEMAINLEGHILAGRLKPEEKECVHQLTRNLVSPKNILNTLKEKNKDSKTNMKQIYNERQKYKRNLKGEMTELQQLLKCLEDNRYFHKFRTDDESSTLQDIFWAHPDSVKLFNTFPTVLLMDSTYKTNRYKMPLFEIVGVTSTELSFNVGFAFLKNEKEDNFIWALETCKSLLKSKEAMPKVIVTDRDKSLMNVVDVVFPNSTALVCRYHVSKNVRKNFKLLCRATKDQNMDELLNTLTFQWESVVESSSEDAYGLAVVEFRRVFEKFPKFLKYVEETVLDPVNEKIVRA
jgi:hypothetical protein